MSINWSNRDFLRMLKTEAILTKDLRIGDVIDADYGYWQVATLDDNGDGTFNVLDEDDNGTSNSSADQTWLILDRTIFSRLTHW